MDRSLDIIKKRGIYSPTPELHPQKNIRISYKYFILFFWLLIISSILYLFFFSKFFIIKKNNILVSGARTQESKIQKIVDQEIDRKSNLFLFPKDDVEQKIKQEILEIADVKIYRGIPDALKIEVLEREKKIVWETRDENFLIDQNGIAYATTQNDNEFPHISDESEVKVEFGNKVVSTDIINFVNELNTNFTRKTNLEISRIYIIESIFDLRVATQKNFYIIFDTTSDCNKQLEIIAEYYPKIQNDVKEYIDLRIKNKIYYK